MEHVVVSSSSGQERPLSEFFCFLPDNIQYPIYHDFVKEF